MTTLLKYSFPKAEKHVLAYPIVGTVKSLSAALELSGSTNMIYISMSITANKMMPGT